jgi:hypothetical protein
MILRSIGLLAVVTLFAGCGDKSHPQIFSTSLAGAEDSALGRREGRSSGDALNPDGSRKRVDNLLCTTNTAVRLLNANLRDSDPGAKDFLGDLKPTNSTLLGYIGSRVQLLFLHLDALILGSYDRAARNLDSVASLALPRPSELATNAARNWSFLKNSLFQYGVDDQNRSLLVAQAGGYQAFNLAEFAKENLFITVDNNYFRPRWLRSKNLILWDHFDGVASFRQAYTTIGADGKIITVDLPRANPNLLQWSAQVLGDTTIAWIEWDPKTSAAFLRVMDHRNPTTNNRNFSLTQLPGEQLSAQLLLWEDRPEAWVMAVASQEALHFYRLDKSTFQLARESSVPFPPLVRDAIKASRNDIVTQQTYWVLDHMSASTRDPALYLILPMGSAKLPYAFRFTAKNGFTRLGSEPCFALSVARE